MTHDIRDALIDALRPVCANPEVAADACLGVMEKWAADEPASEFASDLTMDKIAQWYELMPMPPRDPDHKGLWKKKAL